MDEGAIEWDTAEETKWTTNGSETKLCEATAFRNNYEAGHATHSEFEKFVTLDDGGGITW